MLTPGTSTASSHSLSSSADSVGATSSHEDFQATAAEPIFSTNLHDHPQAGLPHSQHFLTSSAQPPPKLSCNDDDSADAPIEYGADGPRVLSGLVHAAGISGVPLKRPVDPGRPVAQASVRAAEQPGSTRPAAPFGCAVIEEEPRTASDGICSIPAISPCEQQLSTGHASIAHRRQAFGAEHPPLHLGLTMPAMHESSTDHGEMKVADEQMPAGLEVSSVGAAPRSLIRRVLGAFWSTFPSSFSKSAISPA